MRSLIIHYTESWPHDIEEAPLLCLFLSRFRKDLAGVINCSSMMIVVNSVSDETSDYLATTTDGYLDTSEHAYQKGADQNMTADEYWLHYNTTEVCQSYQNKSTDDEKTEEQYSPLIFTLLIFKWILLPFIVTANGLAIIVVMKYVKKITPSHVGIVFLSLAGFFVGIVPFLNLVIHLMGDSVHLRYVCDVMLWLLLAR